MPILMPNAKSSTQKFTVHKAIDFMFEHVKKAVLNVSRPLGRQYDEAIEL